MGKDVPENFENKLLVLKKKYIKEVENLAADLESIQKLDQPWPADIIEQLHTIVHKLAGSGAVFGFTDLSDAASDLNKKLSLQNKDSTFRISQDEYASEIEKILTACRLAIKKDLENINTSERNSTKEKATDRLSVTNTDPYILVVDDDETMRDLVCVLLEDLAPIKIAESAEEALKVLEIEKQHPILILLDDKMTGDLSGIEMLKYIKSLEGVLQDIPVIMLTASDSPNQVMRGLITGAIDYITKPFEHDFFVKKITERVQRSQNTVLIADDDEAVRELLSYKFKTVGWTVMTASNGTEALRLMHEAKPCIAVLDRMMPGQDGLAVMQQMKQASHLSDIPVIFLTAKHHEADILEGLSMGAEDYIVKPFNPEEVIMRCRRLVQKMT